LEQLQAENPEKSVVYVDETGIDEYLHRPRARAKRGMKIYSKIRGKKFERVSIVAGKCRDCVVAPMIFKGTAASVLFESWFDKHFVLK